MTELSLNEMQTLDGGVIIFPVAYAGLALASAAFGFTVGQALF